MAVQVGTAFVDVKGDLSSLHKQLGSFFAGGKLGGMGKKAGLAVGAGLAGGLAAAGAGKALFSLGEQFDNAFDRVRVATGQTGGELRGLQGDLKSVFKETPTDLDSVATAIGGLGSRLEISGKPLRRLAKQLLQLSEITGTDINENVESVTRLFKDWMVPTGQQTEQLNKLFRVGQKTGSTVSNLSRLMVQFGSPLRQLGFDFETAAAMFGRFEKEGVNITTIMPGFRFALKNLAQPTGEAAEQLKKLGISAKDPKVALQDVFKAIKDAPTALKANAIAFAIFGRRAGPDMAAAVREGRFELDKLKGSMENSRDSIGRAETSTRDFGEEWQLLKNRLAVGLEPLARGVFSSISRMLKIVADPNLSGAEKWDRISGIIGNAFQKGFEAASKAAVEFGPKIAAALFRGFLNAPPLVQLLGGAWLLKKATPMLASAGLLGREAGAAFSAGMATTAASGAGAATVAGVAAGAAGGAAAKPKGAVIRRAAAGEVGALAGGALALGPGFRSGEPISQLGRASKVLKPVNAGLATMLTSLRAAPVAWAGLAAAVVIAGIKIKQSKTFEGLTGGLIDDKATKVQQAGLAALRSGLDELTAASRQAQDALPGIASAEENVARLRKQGKTDTHEYAEAVRALDAAEEVRILGLRHQGEAQRKVAEGTKEDLRAALGRLGLDKKFGASAAKLRKDAIDVAQAYSRQAAAQLNVSRGMRGLAAITGPTGTKMGALLKELKGVAGFPAFKKFLITADISQASAAVRIVEKLRTLGREKTALKIIAESKSPEEALKRLRGLVGDLSKREHRITMRLKDEATLRLERLKRTIDRLPEKKKLTVEANATLSRDIRKLLNFAGQGQAAKQLLFKARGGKVKRDELTVVGEEGAELAKLPGGKLQMLGQQGPEVRELPVGTRVYSHPETKRKLPELAQKVIQQLVPASIREPQPLVQRVIQALGTDSGKASQGGLRSRGSESLSRPQFLDTIPPRRRGKRKRGEGEVRASGDPGLIASAWRGLRPHLPKIPRAQQKPTVNITDWKEGAYPEGYPRGGYGEVWLPRWFLGSLADKKDPDNDWAKSSVIHEFVHGVQSLDTLKRRATAEGGAVLFGEKYQREISGATYKAFGQYRAWANQMKKRGPEWVERGQFEPDPELKEKTKKGGKGGDAAGSSRRVARTSQLAGVSVTPSEVSSITQKWGVNRAVASIGAAVKDKFPGMNIISGYFGRENSRTPNNSVSNHARRMALDLGSRGSLNRRIGTWVRANFPNSLRGVSEGVLDIDHDPNPPDHADHVHVAALGQEALAKVMQVGADGPGEAKLRHKGRFTLGQMVSLAKRAHFPDPALAAAIGYAESRGNTAAHNTKGEDSRGLWQINVAPNANPKYKDWDLSDAFRNAKAAFEISKGGKTFQPWTMYTNQQYKQYLGARGMPLPKGNATGTPTGSSKAEYLAMKLQIAEDSPGQKDDIRWINRGLKYWRGVFRRNKAAGNFSRATEAHSRVVELRDKKRELREGPEEVFENLGSLAPTIGTGPNAFRTTGLEKILEQINLKKAQAALTVPADDDDTQAGLIASLQDDIPPYRDAGKIWEGLYTLASGFRVPSPKPPPFNPTKAQSAALNKTKTPEQRIALLKKFMPPAPETWITGTTVQKIDAATNLATAREEFKSIMDEMGKTEGAGPRLRALSAQAALTPGKEDDIAAAQESVRQYQVDYDAVKGGGDFTAIADAAESLKGAMDELKSLIEERDQTKASDSKSFFGSITDLLKNYGGNFRALPSFAKGGFARGWAVVGEEGPELAHFSKPTEIISHPVSKKIAQSMGVPGFAQGTPIQPSHRDPATAQPADMEKFVKQLVKAIDRGEARSNVTQNITFETQPEDAHGFIKSSLFHAEASV